jgi:hypothetical protein
MGEHDTCKVSSTKKQSNDVSDYNLLTPQHHSRIATNPKRQPARTRKFCPGNDSHIPAAHLLLHDADANPNLATTTAAAAAITLPRPLVHPSSSAEMRDYDGKRNVCFLDIQFLSSGILTSLCFVGGMGESQGVCSGHCASRKRSLNVFLYVRQSVRVLSERNYSQPISENIVGQHSPH